MSDRFGNSRFDHEPLSLRVFLPHGPLNVPLRAGLTIGSDPKCDVYLSSIDVEPHHARVTRGLDGRWTVQGYFTNRVHLLDGTVFRDLGLMRGTTFRIGP